MTKDFQVEDIVFYPKGKRKFWKRLQAAMRCLTNKQFVLVSREKDTDDKFDIYYHNLKTVGAGHLMKKIGEQLYDRATFKHHGEQNN